MKSNFLLLFSLVFCLFVNAQGGRRKAPPVLHEVSNKAVVQGVFPSAEKVVKLNDFWFKIVDKKSKILGFAMSSEKYCTEIIGYNNTTPVLIVTDKNKIIKNVSILSNWETLSYVTRLEQKGFFNLWNEKSLVAAKTVEIDAYTGATFTAKAVQKNIAFLIDNGLKKMPK